MTGPQPARPVLVEIRAALDGLAAAMAAKKGAKRAMRDGRPFIARGRAAVNDRSLTEQIAADVAFHAFINELSGNPLIAKTTAPHWPSLRRVMAAVLRDADQMPKAIWDAHAAILNAVAAGDAADAEGLARQHIMDASDIFIGRLQAQRDATDLATEDRRSRRILRSS